MIDYPAKNACGIDLPCQPDVEPAERISHVNWPHTSREHDRAVRWLLATKAERDILREVDRVMHLYRAVTAVSLAAERRER